MDMYEIIRRKRDGAELTDEEIRAFIRGYTDGRIPDYQAAAFCMAVFFRDMTDRETAVLTEAMADSGDRLDLSGFGRLTADKHSTGGVGDKTSLIVIPAAASLGCVTAKMSGRGLGHTGGTVDKLESIPGYRTSLSPEAFLDQVRRVGIAVIGQTGNLTPADKKLYALRDVTATVDSIPLIASSIMSKKLAAGAANIVLDVKAGSGSFMKTLDRAALLADKMVRIGTAAGRNVTAVITDMDVPLGTHIGNALEVREAVAVLRDGLRNDLYEVSVCLTAHLAGMTLGIPFGEAERRVKEAIASGLAYRKMLEWIGAQGGDISCIEDLSKLPKGRYAARVKSPADGYILKMDAETVGRTSLHLGAGRATKEDVIDPGAGIVLRRKTGDRVREGETLCTLYADRKSALGPAKELFLSALTFGAEKPEPRPLVCRVISTAR